MNLSSGQTIRWVEPFEYKAGQPFRIMPIGTFKRGERTLDITAQRLQDMASNYESNRPRWRIPIYAGHPTDTNPDPPKLGNIARLEVRQDGLYATPEWSEEGDKLATNGYQYNSPGVLWSLNGSRYVDEQGKEFDNVIDHVALTNRPFFGQHTALFSADADAIMDSVESFKDYDAETRREFAKKGWALPDGSYPIADDEDLTDAISALGRGRNNPHSRIKAHIIKRAKALGKANLLPADWEGSTKEVMGEDKSDHEHLDFERNALTHQDQDGLTAFVGSTTPARRLGIETSEEASEMIKEKKSMSDEQTTTSPPAAPAVPETLTVKPDEFAALKAKAEEAEKLAAQVGTLQKQADQFAAELKKVSYARRHDQLLARYETFMAVPEKPVTLAEKMHALEDHDPKLFEYFDALLKQLDDNLVKAGLFSQIASERAGEQAETIEAFTDQLVREKFNSDMTRYAEAFDMAQKQRPDLAEAYRFRGRR